VVQQTEKRQKLATIVLAEKDSQQTEINRYMQELFEANEQRKIRELEKKRKHVANTLIHRKTAVELMKRPHPKHYHKSQNSGLVTLPSYEPHTRAEPVREPPKAGGLWRRDPQKATNATPFFVTKLESKRKALSEKKFPKGGGFSRVSRGGPRQKGEDTLELVHVVHIDRVFDYFVRTGFISQNTVNSSN
jgi:hypothetical protein